jgi:hypothetical protein
MIHRRQPWEISIEEAELFCKRFKGYYEDSMHKFLGGEPTAIPPEKFYKLIDIFVDHGRKIKLLSNGFNLLGLKKSYLTKFSSIELNDHGINHDHITDCFRYLKTFYKGELYSRIQNKHYNLGEVRKHCVPGVPCESIMNPPVLCRGVMYPCCVHPSGELWNNDWETREALIEAGWGLDNPDVADVLVNWRDNLPLKIYGECNDNCWVLRRVNVNVDKVPITLKHNDVIKR